MKKQLLTLCLAGALSVGANAQNLIYSNDFEGDQSALTIHGSGQFEASGDAAHGQVYHNNPVKNATSRTNYLQLPATIFSAAQTAINTSQGLTISFWVNDNGVGVDSEGFWWSSMFSAYGNAPSPNNAKPMLQLNTNKRLNVNFDYTTSDTYNYGWFDNLNWGTDNLEVLWLDNGGWHFYTITITPTSSKVYIDGVLSSSKTADLNNGTRVDGLFHVAGELSYITLGGNSAWNWGDKDTPFSYDKIKIYDGTLTPAQINSLMTTDQISSPVLAVSKTLVSIDDVITSETFTVDGSNLTNDIAITAPSGVTVNPTTISKSSASNVTVTVTFNGTTFTSGDITLTSGSITKTVAVRTSSNASCYTPLFSSGNLNSDPYCNSLATYGGWGGRSVETSYVYCGSRSLKISGKCGGSIDFGLNGKIVGGKTYRVKAMVSTNGTGEVKIGVAGATASNIVNALSTAANEWLPIDFTFTAQAVPNAPNMYFNSCETQTATAAFIDNWEMYEVSPTTGLSGTSLVNQNVYVRNNQLVVDFNLNKADNVRFEIYNTQGMLLSTQHEQCNEGTNSKILNTNLSAGVYFVRTNIDGRFVINKIVF